MRKLSGVAVHTEALRNDSPFDIDSIGGHRLVAIQSRFLAAAVWFYDRRASSPPRRSGLAKAAGLGRGRCPTGRVRMSAAGAANRCDT